MVIDSFADSTYNEHLEFPTTDGERMELNINDMCMVTLTPSGAATWNKWESQYENLTYTKPNYKQSGETLRASLWHLFQVFGSSIHMGGEVPFEYCVITLEDK